MARKRLVAVSAALMVLGMGTLPSNAVVGVVEDDVVHVRNVPGTTGGHVAVEGNRLYMGNYGTGFSIFDIADPRTPKKLGQWLPGPQGAGDAGVRTDAVPDATVMDGRHIVAFGGTNRAPGTRQTEFVDVTDPAAPRLLVRFPADAGPTYGESHNSDIVDSRRLWLPSGRGVDMFRIHDLNPLLQNPPGNPTKLFGGNLNTMWLNSPYRPHVGNPAGGLPTHIHDLEVYTDYRLLLLPDQWIDQNGDGIADPTYGERDLAFVAASQEYATTVGGVQTTPNENAVYIVDITDPRNPVIINKIQTRAGQHRYLHEVQVLQGNPRIMFTSDEDLHNGCDAGGVHSWQLSEDLTDATFLDTWYNGTGTPAPVCSAHVFSSHGDKVFMGSYNAGLQVIDFSNPADLKRAGQYIAPGANSWGALYNRGYVYVGDFGGRGLDVFEFIDDPVAEGLVKTGNPANRRVPGISEAAAGCDQASPANSVDAMIFPIPNAERDGNSRIRGVTSEGPGTELDIWFLNQNCELIEGGLSADAGPQESGFIPAEAAFASISLYTGTPSRVYAQIDP